MDGYPVDGAVSFVFGGHMACVFLSIPPHLDGVFLYLRFSKLVVVFISSGWLACGWFHTRGTWVDGFFFWPVRGGQRGFSLP